MVAVTASCRKVASRKRLSRKPAVHNPLTVVVQMFGAAFREAVRR